MLTGFSSEVGRKASPLSSSLAIGPAPSPRSAYTVPGGEGCTKGLTWTVTPRLEQQGRARRSAAKRKTSGLGIGTLWNGRRRNHYLYSPAVDEPKDLQLHVIDGWTTDDPAEFKFYTEAYRTWSLWNQLALDARSWKMRA